MFSNLAVNDDGRSSDIQRIADILPVVLAKYLAPETQSAFRVELRPSHNAFPLRFEMSTGSSLSRAAGHFNSLSEVR